MPAQLQLARAASSETVCRSCSSASGVDIVSLEAENRLAEGVGNWTRLPLREVDVDERLVRGDHQQLVGKAIGGEGERDTRAPEPRDAHEDLNLVVEHRGREVLDLVRPHHEVARLTAPLQQTERAEVLDPGEVEVGVVAAVVHDPLGVGVREADAGSRAELEGRLHERITSSTSSRFSSIRASDVASRLSRSSGSVLEGRTLKCQSSKSTEIPSRWDTRPSAYCSFSSCSFSATSGTGVLSSPVMKYRERNGARISDSRPLLEISSSMRRNGTTPESAWLKSRK